MKQDADGRYDLFSATDLPKPYKYLKSFINYIDVGIAACVLLLLFIVWNMLVGSCSLTVVFLIAVLAANAVGLIILHFQLVRQDKKAMITYIVIFLAGAVLRVGIAAAGGAFALDVFTVISLGVPLLILAQIYYFVRQGVLK